MKLIHKKKLAQNRNKRKFNPKKLHLSVGYPKPNKNAKSYWIERNEPMGSMKNQF